MVKDNKPDALNLIIVSKVFQFALAGTSLPGVRQSKLNIIFAALTCIDSRFEKSTWPQELQIQLTYHT